MVRDFLSPAEGEALLQSVDSASWLPLGGVEGARRVQQYGVPYDHRLGTTDSTETVPQPGWCQRLGKTVAEAGFLERVPDQVIINEYLPGQGIGAHTDSPDSFGPTVVSITLGSPVLMDFHEPESDRIFQAWLETGSLLRMTGPSRYLWRHSIAKRTYDMVEGGRVERQRRVSLTFRTVEEGKKRNT